MILTPDDLQAMNTILAERQRLDPVLARRCEALINQGHYPAAVQQAFTVLEDRLREKTGPLAIGLTSNDIIKTGLGSARAPLAEALHLDSTEAAALRDLLSGLFRFYRNPAAHTLVDYDAYEAQSLMSIINLLLRRLEKVVAEPKTKYEPFFRAVVANLPRFLPPHLQHITFGPTTEEKYLRLFFPGELRSYYEIFFRRSALELAYRAEVSAEANQPMLTYFKKQLPTVQGCFGQPMVAELADKGLLRFGHYLQPKPELAAEHGAHVAERLARLIQCTFTHVLTAEQLTATPPPPPPPAAPTPSNRRRRTVRPPASEAAAAAAPTPAPQPAPQPATAEARPAAPPATTEPAPPPATAEGATPAAPTRRRRRRK